MEPVPPAASATHRTVRILYAEDVRELRELARILFTREGHAIDCVPDGTYALDLLKNDPTAYDLLITDHHMPVLNGLRLVLALRQLPYHGKIIVFSSEMNPAIAAEYRKLLVDGVLFKPIYPSLLRQTIAELFPLERSVPASHVGSPS